MTRANPPWILVEFGTMRVICNRCTAGYTPNLPAPIGVVTAIWDSFAKDHRSCRETVNQEVSFGQANEKNSRGDNSNDGGERSSRG